MELVGVAAPVVGVKGAQAGLFVDGVEGPVGLPGQGVGFEDGRVEASCVEIPARAGDRFGRVIERGDLESGGG